MRIDYNCTFWTFEQNVSLQRRVHKWKLHLKTVLKSDNFMSVIV
jgi:hypothetical protein